jgi:hypothetical protein
MSAELCTDQGDRIRTAFESFKDFGYESVIYFRPHEVELVAQEHSKVVDIRLVLPADKIRETGGSYKYECDEPQIELGIRTKVVATALKRFSPGDRVVIGARKGEHREFFVSCRNKNKDFTAEIVAPILDTASLVTPQLRGVFKYAGSIVMGSAAFHCIIGDLLTADPPVIEFECDGSSLKVSGEGMFSKSCVQIGQARVFGAEAWNAGMKVVDECCEHGGIPSEEEEEEEDEDDSPKKKKVDEEAPAAAEDKRKAVFVRDASQPVSAWNVRRSYATLHLSRIAKAKNMSGKITISLSQEFPASFEYDTPIGRLTYLVCARAVDDIDDPKLKPPPEFTRSTRGGAPPAEKRGRFAVKEPEAEFDSDGFGGDEEEEAPRKRPRADDDEDIDVVAYP